MRTRSESDSEARDAKCADESITSSLIAKWKKTGYEKLCCLRCIQTRVRCHFANIL